MSFIPFPSLPNEIRLQIWNHAVPIGRVLRVLLTHKLETFVYPFEAHRTPTILHVCHESRQVGLGVFHHNLGARHNDHFWWNPTVDTVFRPSIAPENAPKYNAPDFIPNDDGLEERGLSKTLQYTDLTQHLAIPLTLSTFEFLSLNLSRSEKITTPQWLNSFPRLRTLTLLLDPLTDWIRMGEVVPCEPLETPISGMDDQLPSEIVTMVEESIGLFGMSAEMGWVPPTVHISVVMIKRTRREASSWLPELAIESEKEQKEIQRELSGFRARV